MIIKDELIKVNFTEGRSGHKINMLVIHIMEGTMAGTLSWFRNPRSKVSAHYGNPFKGDIVRYVKDEDTAWHAGKVVNPTATLIKARPGINPNLEAIGIENEGYEHTTPTNDQYSRLIKLCYDLCHKHSIPIDRKHIVGHREIRGDKSCPGNIDVNKLVIDIMDYKRSISYLDKPVIVGSVVWSEYFHDFLVVTSYVDDKNWFFVPLKDARKMQVKAQTPLSQMSKDKR